MSRARTRSTSHRSADDARSASEPKRGSTAARGVALEPTTRAAMEQSFHFDFSGVRVHADDHASALAEELGARAMTVGSDLFFAASRFAPETRDGELLLAHELAHVVQNSLHPAGPLPFFSARGSAAEAEATTVAAQVIAGHSVSPSAAPAATVARDEDDGNFGIDLGSDRGLITDDHPGEKLDLFGAQFQAGKFGKEGKKRFGIHGAASAFNYNNSGGVQGGDAQAGGLNVDANVGEDGFALGAGATAAQVAVRGGNLDAPNGEDLRFGLSAGPSIGVRGSWDKGEDGRRIYGMGADLGFASFDLKTKDPLGTLEKHQGLFTSNPMTQGIEAAKNASSIVSNLFGGPSQPTPEDSSNKTEGLASWLQAEKKILQDPSSIAGSDAN